MIVLWILGILAALILLICLLRVGAEVSYDGELRVNARIGFLRLHLLPGKQKDKKQKVKKKEEKPAGAKKKTKNQFSFSEIKDGVKTLWPALRKALERTRRGVKLHPLTVSVTVGGLDDPAAAAEHYGQLQAAVWGGMPVLEQLLVIPDPHIHVGVDFDRPDWSVTGNAGVSARVGTLLRIGLTVLIPAVKWYTKCRKNKKTTPKTAKTAA